MKIEKMLLLAVLSIFLSACPTNTPGDPPPPPPVGNIELTPSPYFLHLSDIHLDLINEGDLGKRQDTGPQLWAAAKAALKDILQGKNPPEFVIYTGDLPGHLSCGRCATPASELPDHDSNFVSLLTDLRDLVQPKKIPFFFVPGNNDAIAGDYYSFADADSTTPLDLIPEKSNPFPALNTASNCGNAPCMLPNQHEKLGYYAAKAIPGLRIIGMNSVILGKHYHNVYGPDHNQAAEDHLNWLGQQLEDAKKDSEKVFLAMHIPPGLDAYSTNNNGSNSYMWGKPAWVQKFLRLAETYSSTITGILYGHTHMDEVRKLYDSTNTKITEVAMSCPGITPINGNNPGFKKVYFDLDSKEILNFTTYYSHKNATTWENKFYRSDSVFHCPDSMSLYDCLCIQNDSSQVDKAMAGIYTVGRGVSTFSKLGIEVKY